jgi:glycosyltransferase involved in cell wall biosynthesis
VAHATAALPQHDTILLATAREQFARQAAALARRGKFIVERSLDAAAVARLTRVIANSSFTAEAIRRIYGRSADAVIYPTVLSADVPLPRRAGPLDSTGLRVLAHSRLEPLKNIAMVLLGFHAFRARHPGAHELHVVGQGDDLAVLQTLASTLGLERAIHFHGFLDQSALESVYARCEVMALLPADEPFGMVFPEAAQRGLLLMGPDHGGPLEILEDGTLGWALDIFSPEPLAEAFAEAWQLPAHEVARRREHAASVCRDRYGPQATLPALLAQLVD